MKIKIIICYFWWIVASAETWHLTNPWLSPQSLPFIPAIADSTKATTTFQQLHQEMPPNYFPQKFDHFRGSQAIHCDRFLQLAGDSTMRSLFVSFAVSFAEVHGDCSCNSRKCIAIACADHWFDCNRGVGLAEVVAVAVRDLAESLQLLYAIAAGSSWLLQAHCIFAIASAICRIPRGLILRLAEFIAIQGRGKKKSMMEVCHGWGNIKVGDEWARRNKAA